MSLTLLLLTAPLWVQQSGLPTPQGVTILDSRDHAAQLRDVEELISGERYRAAAALLQQLLEADPAIMVRPGEELLFRGASHEARLLLDEVPAALLEAREALVGERAHSALMAALEPPDPEALLKVSQLYAGTRAAQRARAALDEVLLDRGHFWRAARGRELGEVLDPDWMDALPAPRPDAALRAPSLTALTDSTLPLVRAGGALKRWSYIFDPDSPLPRNYRNHRMALAGGVGYLTDSREVVALDLGSGDVVWRFDGPAGWDRLTDVERDQIKQAFDYDSLMSPVLAEGILLVTLQEPIKLGRLDQFRHIDVRRLLPGRRLYALDATNGEVLWKQDVEWLRGRQTEPRGLVAAPPAVAAGRVFVPIYDAVGTIDLSLHALDLYTGEPLWDTFVVSGQRETNLFGNVLRELAAGVPVADPERVLLCTNLGVVACLEADTGAVIWSRIYERTVVRTNQTGQEGHREPTYANNPPAYDGDRYVCTPTDSQYALVLRAEDGRLLDRIRHNQNGRQRLRRLVASTPAGVLLSGRKLIFKPAENRSGLGWTSHKDLYPSLSSSEGYDNGVVARDEILIPDAEGVLRLDPRNGRTLDYAFQWSSTWEKGSLQAAPGLLLVLNRKGVTAYASAEALLESLITGGTTTERLAQILPFLEGLDLSSDPDKASRVARAALSQAEAATNREQVERLLMVAARAWHDAKQPLECARTVRPVLGSSDPLRRLAAATTVVEVLQSKRPNDPLFERALEILATTPATQLVLRNGLVLPTAIVVARARYLSAEERGDRNAMRAALLALLARDDVRQIETEAAGPPLSEWALVRLQALVRADPTQASALEADARTAFANQRITQTLVEAFAETQTARQWLRTQSRRTDLTRRELVEIAAWTRDFGVDETSATTLKLADTLFGEPPERRLPTALQILTQANVDYGKELLAVEPFERGALILLQSNAELLLGSIQPGRPLEILNEVQLDRSDRAFPSLRRRALLDVDGATVLVADQWTRIGRDGSQWRLQLPGNVTTPPHRMGRMGAFICQAEGHTQYLQIRDLATGALFMEHRLTRNPMRLRLLYGGPEVLTLLENKTREGLFFQPLLSSEPVPFKLSWSPTSSELETAVSCGDGVVVSSAEKNLLFVARMNQNFVVELPEKATAKLIAAPGGASWLLNPIFPGQKPFPKQRLAWLPREARDAGEMEVQASQSRFYQIRSATGTRVPRPELLAVTRSHPARNIRIEVFDLDGVEQDGQPDSAWNHELEDLAFGRLVYSQPRPISASNGWFVPLHLKRHIQQDQVYPAEVLNLLYNEYGLLIDKLSTLPPRSTGSNSLEAYLANGAILLRSNNALYLLGNP